MAPDPLIGIFIGDVTDAPYLWLQKNNEGNYNTFDLTKFEWTGSFTSEEDDLMISPECMVTWK